MVPCGICISCICLKIKLKSVIGENTQRTQYTLPREKQCDQNIGVLCVQELYVVHVDRFDVYVLTADVQICACNGSFTAYLLVVLDN